MNANSRTARKQRGFTIMQMLITLAIIAVVSTFGIMGIRTARAEFRLQNSARLFATYIEKARADSVRRHAGPGQEASVETFEPGTDTYAIRMDFGSGAVETRNFQLESGLSFNTLAKKVTFDWRGRIAEAWVFQIRSEFLNQNYPVDVSGSGDITVGSQHFLDQDIPDVEISEVTEDEDTGSDPIPTPTATPTISPSPSPDPTDSPTPSESATPTPTPNGNGNGNDGNNGNGNPNPTPSPTPQGTATPTPTPSPTPIPQCISMLSPSSITISQSDETNQTGSAIFTMTNATGVRVISASQAGNGNALNIGVSLQRIDGNGSTVISVTAKHGAGNRGTFVVNVSADPACGSTQQLTVSVSN